MDGDMSALVDRANRQADREDSLSQKIGVVSIIVAIMSCILGSAAWMYLSGLGIVIAAAMRIECALMRATMNQCVYGELQRELLAELRKEQHKRD